MKMNELPVISKTVQNLLKMRTALLELPEQNFNMHSWVSFRECGTAYCLLGAYVAKYGDETGLQFSKLHYPESIEENSRDVFDAHVDASRAIGITLTDA